MKQLLTARRHEGWDSDEHDENDAGKEEDRTIIPYIYHYKCHVIIISFYVLKYYIYILYFIIG